MYETKGGGGTGIVNASSPEYASCLRLQEIRRTLQLRLHLGIYYNMQAFRLDVY